jgi:hypothetical protein
MDKWVKLHIRKQFINLAIKILNRVIPSREAQFPQTKILARVYADLLHVYKIEAYCGRFDDVPYGTLDTLKDKNFLRFLQLSNSVLTYLGDTDRYYRAWLGLFFLLIRDHTETLPLADAGRSVMEQWDYPECQEVFTEYARFFEKDAREAILSNHLYNLVKLTLNRGEKYNDRNTIDRP